MPKRLGVLKLPPINPEDKNILLEKLADPSAETMTVSKDNVGSTPQIDFMLEQSKQEELKIFLERKREQAAATIKQLTLQWKALEQKELSFQRTIVTHNRFLRRNLEKRERACSKLQNDTELIKKRVRDTKLLSQKYSYLKGALGKLRGEIDKHSIYQDYLSLVLKQIDCPFKSLFEFLTKLEVLLDVKDLCMNRQNEEMLKTVKIQNWNLQHFRYQRITFIGLRNEVNNLSCRYDETIRKNLTTESLLQNIIVRTNNLNCELQAGQHMIDAIYRHICSRRGLSAGSFDLKDIEPKLEIIKRTLAGYLTLMSSLQKKEKSKDIRKYTTVRKYSVPKEEEVTMKVKEPDPVPAPNKSRAYSNVTYTSYAAAAPDV